MNKGSRFPIRHRQFTRRVDKYTGRYVLLVYLRRVAPWRHLPLYFFQPQLLSDNMSDRTRGFRPACAAAILDYFLTLLRPRDPASECTDYILRSRRPGPRAFLLHKRDVAILLPW